MAVESKRCRGCGAWVMWAVTLKGTPIPLDPEPVEGPQAVYWLSAGGIAHDVETFSDKPEREGLQLYRPHRVTCPQRRHVDKKAAQRARDRVFAKLRN